MMRKKRVPTEAELAALDESLRQDAQFYVVAGSPEHLAAVAEGREHYAIETDEPLPANPIL